MASRETFVQREQHRIYVRDHPGAEPAIILMHGFPDNVHLYDRLAPYLSPPRRVVLFDFLGWGSSDKPSGYPYTADNQIGDLDAVITQLGLGQVVLVAHDASGPPAIDWALAHPERVAGLALLNTYYCEMPTLRPPEAIWLFSTPVIREIEAARARADAADYGSTVSIDYESWGSGGRSFKSLDYFARLVRSVSRCLIRLSSSSVCCAIRSAFRASSSAPENAAACSTSCRMLSRIVAMRSSSSGSESELPLLMMFFPGQALTSGSAGDTTTAQLALPRV